MKSEERKEIKKNKKKEIKSRFTERTWSNNAHSLCFKILQEASHSLRTAVRRLGLHV